MLGGLILLLAATMPALAGRNGGGSIVVHTTDSYTYLSTTVCTSTLGVPANCAAAGTRTDKGTGALIWFLASFVPEATPVVSVIYFGINFDSVNLDPSTKYGPCAPAGSLEAPDTGWPTGDPVAGISGNSLAFGTPMTGSTMFPFYYFKVDDFSGGAPAEPFLCSAINPTGNYAAFIDDAFPGVQDNITRFGCVKWYSDTGYNTCPVPPPTGACCVSSGDQALCQIVGSKNECDALLGTYQGDNTLCDKPCSACCYWDGDPTLRYCVVTTEADCTTGSWSLNIIPDGWGHNVGSAWAYVPPDAAFGIVCATEPPPAQTTRWFCQDPRDYNATKPATWGQLKALYR